MANYWVITIGINQYRHIQPLMHAQSDALFVHKFFTEEAGTATNRCVLLSDLTTSVGAQVVYPDKPAIAQWIQTITAQISPGDVLWFFFSGYGTQLEGADYLMPIDGDPDRIEETGIALSDLIDTLAQLPTDKAVLVLDINRSQGALAGHTIGTQVIELAEKRHVATLLSCQPEQYSHETLGVRHGLFTAALLEALQQGHSTLKQISDYLAKRLPELCEHHWRPVQNAVAIMTDEQKIATLVPALTTSLNSITSAATSSDLASSGSDSKTSISKMPDNSLVAQTESSSIAAAVGVGAIAANNHLSGRPYTEKSTGTKPYQASQTSRETIGSALDNKNESVDELPPRNPNSSAIVPYETQKFDDKPSAINGAKLRNWGLLALALLMGLVLLKQPFVKAAWDNLIDKLEVATGWNSDSEEGDLEGVDANTAASAEDPVAENPRSEQTTAIATAPSAENSQSETATPPPAADNPGAQAETVASNTPASEDAKARTAALIAQANAALSKKQYSEALATLKEVPKDQRDSTFSSILIKARVGAAEAEQTNAALLTDALTAIQPAQASQFTEAIAKARRIQPGEPIYEEAQQNIKSWSQTILDIAEGRAASGALEGAIAAAQVVPRDNAEAYQKAQGKISYWQQRQQSRAAIEVAKTIPKTGQASTYQKGIVKLREVPIEHPEYEAAQRLADEWSDRIFSIAQARAAQGREEAAIQAALLVPAGTTAYEPTQQAIRRWRTEAKSS
ncbi:MAG: caspase family protein [Phormidesmis sp.]